MSKLNDIAKQIPEMGFYEKHCKVGKDAWYPTIGKPMLNTKTKDKSDRLRY